MKSLFKAPTLAESAWMYLGTAFGMIWVFAALSFSIPAVLFNLFMGLYFLWLDKKKLVIKDDEGPYLTRWHLLKAYVLRTFLHHIHRPDKDRDPHNHPWPFACSFVLFGGYTERITELDGELRITKIKTHLAGSFSFEAFRPGRYHRIIDVLPGTWTLFVAGPRSRDWGFLVDTTHVPCREYLDLPTDHDFGD